MNVIEEIEKGEIERLVAERPVPEFSPGDTVRVHYKVVDCLLYTSDAADE